MNDAKSWLVHHGILGMKWGVRKYQNPDGSLTEAGKLRYYGKYGGNDSDRSSAKMQRERSGIVEGDKYDIIKRGQKIQRMADENEKNDHRRKYVSLTSDDNEFYRDSAYSGALEGSAERMKEHHFVSKKDLKIVKSEAVLDYLMKDLPYNDDGDPLYMTKVEDAIKQLPELQKLDRLFDSISRQSLKSVDKKVRQEVSKKRQEAQSKIYNYVQKVFIDNPIGLSKVTEYFKSKGYDGMVDVQDLLGTSAQYPVVVFDPLSSMKEV